MRLLLSLVRNSLFSINMPVAPVSATTGFLVVTLLHNARLLLVFLLLNFVSLVGVIILMGLLVYGENLLFSILLRPTLLDVAPLCQVHGALTLLDPPMQLLKVATVW